MFDQFSSSRATLSLAWVDKSTMLPRRVISVAATLPTSNFNGG